MGLKVFQMDFKRFIWVWGGNVYGIREKGFSGGIRVF